MNRYTEHFSLAVSTWNEKQRL